ncbi:3,4-dihydroxy-2-butanone-4-phosphate synthase [Candidatus Tokpelaia sp.]|uniref:3,4-dihydroxy-2-butanone-4-phosphate synthase n=1 Tax=Candidatus Tokpelaia sp. TaxID=2233777 RepID=UPI00123C4B51|nr:3,4-dihydroxy-2-butanone-4-phosphate synthase [Candidatus Tokpelaia sp.]KAA6405330.1 3,4-dihydroxy-2-butanone-4-phosphate synthase [Candidatus Tokpelaia sp.]
MSEQKNENAVDAALEAFARGEIVVVTDDGGRENEGDLIIAAVHCTPEKMAFIVRHTSGIVCAAMPKAEARRLNLAPMVADNDSPHSTAFTVTVDYKHGTTTGISAADRTLTVRNLANPNAGAEDFVRPGHVFPLIAREGGVLTRSGHTEATVDLCLLAGLPPIGALCELVNDDGTVMRGPQIAAFAEKHGLHCVTVADLISRRRHKERLVEHIGTMPIETVAGRAQALSYQLPFENLQHLALVLGDIGDGDNVPVRIHREAVLSDVFGRRREVDFMLRRMREKYGRGVFVYLREGSAGVNSGADDGHYRDNTAAGGEAHKEAQLREEEWRQIGLGAQILRDLGLRSIILLASKERHYVGLTGFGIHISATDIV